MRHSRSRFRSWVEQAFERIPEAIRREFSNLAITVQDEPTREQLLSSGVPLDSTLLGLYEGVPLDRRAWGYQMVLPDRITLFQGPIERHGGDIRQVVYETLWHELAHHLGMDEDEVAAAELRKFRWSR